MGAAAAVRPAKTGPVERVESAAARRRARKAAGEENFDTHEQWWVGLSNGSLTALCRLSNGSLNGPLNGPLTDL